MNEALDMVSLPEHNNEDYETGRIETLFNLIFGDDIILIEQLRTIWL